jgi:hypothetical protein
VLSLPPLLLAALIAVTITLATLSLFIAAIIIRRTLSLFVLACHCSCVVACHRLPLMLQLLVNFCHYPLLPISRDPPTKEAGEHIGEPINSPLLSDGRCVHSEPTHSKLMLGKAGIRTTYHSSSVTLITGHYPLLQRLVMVDCCVF